MDVYGNPANEVRGGKSYDARPDAPAMRATITGALDRQSELVGSAHDLMTRLEERLTYVVGPAAPGNKGNGAVTAANPVNVLDRLQMHNGGIEGLLERLHGLEQRLQL